MTNQYLEWRTMCILCEHPYEKHIVRCDPDDILQVECIEENNTGNDTCKCDAGIEITATVTAYTKIKS